MHKALNLSLEVPYTWGFYPSQGPVLLNYVAALNGFKPVDLSSGFTYLEVGSGNGVTVNTLAAALPNGDFHAIDIVPQHIANGRADAQTGELGNVTYHECDFASIGSAAIPKFDFITAHGLYSWIAPEQRAALVRLISDNLKPGGIVYLGYNAMPGWAALMPLRRILQDYVARAPGTPLQQVSAATEKLAIDAMVGLEYFKLHPSAISAVSEMATLDPVYVLHEYFNFDFDPQYFEDVAHEMTAAGLTFAGLTQIDLNFPDFAAPEEAQKYLPELEDRVQLEQLRDFARNQKFRGDVYVKGGPLDDPQDATAAVIAMPFGTTRPAAAFDHDAKLHCGGIDYRAPVFDALIKELDHGARTVEALWEAPGLAEYPRDELFSALRLLTLSGAVAPFLSPSQGTPAAVPDRIAMNGAFNAMAMERHIFSDRSLALASPVCGTGIQLTGPDALVLAGLVAAGREGAVAHGWSLVGDRELDLMIDGVPMKEQHQWEAWASRRVTEIADDYLTKWLELGLIRPA
ncbi:MAG: class I SAM-dependent methyltransferase [Alphaproteobacteria bacterium]|nr:class I SAM-dependent methyltransferase [Alphaproteobacteria bacterium]